MSEESLPDPGGIDDLDSLRQAFTALRRRNARPGQIQLSVRDLAVRTGRPASTLHPYLTGTRLCPATVFEEILRALNVAPTHMRPWLDAWDRLADLGASSGPPPGSTPAAAPSAADLLSHNDILRYRVHGLADDPLDAWVSVVTGDVRQVRDVDVWVNSENSGMQMSRFDDFSISAAIRYEGADWDNVGRVVEDRIAMELAAKVAGRTPVAPAAAIVTGPGKLAQRNGVRHIVHVAAVQGEPGAGYRPVVDIGRCVTNAFIAVEGLGSVDTPIRSILFPLLGTGVGGGALRPTITRLLSATLDYFSRRRGPLREALFLASTGPELDACREVLKAHPRLRRDMSSTISVGPETA
jgi:O-acetyl-ADP-ribose deacetylase (regulator of RNase III)